MRLTELARQEEQNKLRKQELDAERYKKYLRYQQIKSTFKWIDEYLDD